jgi:hypothetical protein
MFRSKYAKPPSLRILCNVLGKSVKIALHTFIKQTINNVFRVFKVTGSRPDKENEFFQFT